LLAFIPIANIYLITKIANLPGWYALGILLTFIPIIGQLAIIVLFGYIGWKIAERLKRHGW
jgi:hypothetical protein